MTASSASRPASPISRRRPRRTTPAPGWCAPSPAKNPRSDSLNGSIANTSPAPCGWFSSWACCGPRSNFILGVSMIITLLVGGHLVIAHRISVGKFVAFNTYMILLDLAHHRRGLGGEHLPARHRFCKAHRRVAARRAGHRRQQRRPAIQADTVLQGEIEFRHLNFSYGETLSIRVCCATSRSGFPPAPAWPL